MDTTTYFEQRLPGQMHPAVTTGQPPQAECAPPRRLRSSKRRALVERQAHRSPNHNKGLLPAPKRLRRMQAYSDLECSSRSRDSPTIPISVHQMYWLEDAVTKTWEILRDKETAENFLQHGAVAPSVESLITPVSSKRIRPENVPRLSLTHKNKTDDLRSKYSFPTSSDGEPASSESLHRKSKSEDLRARYSSPPPISAEPMTPESLPSLEASHLSTSNNETSAGTSLTTLPLASPAEKPQHYLYCICQQTFDPSLGEMVACDICDGWFHLRCVGQDQHEATYFEDESFYCPRCEAFAYREIVSDEKEEREGGLVDL